MPLLRAITTALCVLLISPAAPAERIDIASPSVGILVPGQSFNGETRGADITNVRSEPQHLFTLGFEGVVVTEPSFFGVRVYDGAGSLLLSNTQFFPGVGEFLAGLPVDLILQPGVTYRFAVFVAASAGGNTGILFDPNPPGTGGYPFGGESGEIVRVEAAFAGVGDVFPTTPDLYIPQLVLDVVTQVPEPSALLLLWMGVVSLWLGRRCRGGPRSRSP